MSALPSRPNRDHLKKQAKDLLRQYHAHDPRAFDRLRTSLPAAAGKNDTALAALDLRLHDAQSCIAREYGFDSWDALSTYLDRGHVDEPAHLMHRWINLVYGHENERPRPEVAARMLDDHPAIVDADPIVACATGDEAALRRALAQDATWVNRTPPFACPDCGAALGRPPLIAVTHSSLIRLAAFRDRLRRSAALLLDAGADPNQRWSDRPGQSLSALYGAAGLNHDPDVTRLLLRAGAAPNDNESLYHSTESADHTCMTLLLDAGAVVEGSNALHHQLDKDDLAGLTLLLARTHDPNDAASTIGAPLVWAIRRHRSLAHVQALLDAGADPHAGTKDGVSAYRFARRNGRSDVAALLAEAGAGESLSLEDQFVSACAANDRAEARRLLTVRPNVVAELSARQLQQLPELAAAGYDEAVELMVELGWPIATRGGDWRASALNLAVFRGDATLARFLLDHGASWTERHGYNSNVSGTLAWASRNRPAEPNGRDGDWRACAEVLIAHGMPADLPEQFGEDVAEYLATIRQKL